MRWVFADVPMTGLFETIGMRMVMLLRGKHAITSLPPTGHSSPFYIAGRSFSVASCTPLTKYSYSVSGLSCR